ncbi:MAG: phage tail protein [Armatimonadetes bacterium]|nr:phage tail protein [Armatimonadota bacterium]MBS1726591.1 phage tail protein [Armatimonadota bacterium]
MDPFIGEIRPVGFNFAPVGWALCQGQILPIAQNTALFSLLGTTYGGNGTSTFALPNLQGNVAISSGQGPGLSNYSLGQVGGENNVLLQVATMPMHNHPMAAFSASAGAAPTPVGNYPSKENANAYGTTPNATMEMSSVIADGGGQPHNNMQPYLTINYIIALVGIFPSRS